MLFQLFGCFFKIGLFTFGGGYAMLPLMRAELVDKHHWITDEDLLDYFSLSQCTPGVIAINVATFVGFRLKSVIGALTATTAVVLPSLMVILSIATVLTHYMENPYVSHAFNGIRVVVVALIANILVDLWRKGIKTKQAAALFAVCLSLIAFAHFTPAVLVLSVMAFSIVKQRFFTK